MKRLDPTRAGKLTSIIFIRDKTASGQEVSGYIDYAHRLKVRFITLCLFVCLFICVFD